MISKCSWALTNYHKLLLSFNKLSLSAPIPQQNISKDSKCQSKYQKAKSKYQKVSQCLSKLSSKTPNKRECSIRLLKLGFSHQTAPPGPIRGYLEPFLILATFHGVIPVLKWLPGVRDTGKLQIPGVPDTREPRIPGVLDTRELFFECSLVFSNFNQLLQPLSNNQSKNCASLLVIVQIHLVLNFVKNSYLPYFFCDSQCPGPSHFKTWITPGKCFKIPNGFRKCLKGPGGAVWWKNRSKKISCYSPFKGSAQPILWG